jgi:hypothetical protein
MTEIENVIEYNRKARKRWEDAAEKSEYPRGTMPSLSMYLFITKTGEPRKTGYVFSTKTSARWFKTKKEARKALKDVV